MFAKTDVVLFITHIVGRVDRILREIDMVNGYSDDGLCKHADLWSLVCCCVAFINSCLGREVLHRVFCAWVSSDKDVPVDEDCFCASREVQILSKLLISDFFVRGCCDVHEWVSCSGFI